MTKILNHLFRVIEVLIAVFLALMILLVFVNVVARYVFNYGFVWSEEVSRLCFIFLVYLGSIEAARDNRHLMIDTLMLKVPPLAQKVIYTVVQACIIWLMVIQTQGSWGLVMQNRNNVWITTGFPAHIVHFFGVILGASIALLAASNIVRLFVFKIPVTELVAIREGADDDGAAGGGTPATVE